MTDWTLCIDFGTAFSKAAATPSDAWVRFDPAAVRPLMLRREPRGNPFLLESAVFVDEERVLFGPAAIVRAEQLANTKRMALRSFKTLLSAPDLDRALSTNAPASIDPSRDFQMRDLVVLYLAYLLAATERACGSDTVLKGATFRRRYAAPAWRGDKSADMHAAVVRLFGEAEAFRAAARAKLLVAEGVPIDFIRKALPAAMAKPQPLDMGLIFEATAAVSYSSIGLKDASSHLIVVDMGAGTTDIAGLAHHGERLSELPDVRVTLKQAGDFLDRVITNQVLESASWARGVDQKSELWGILMRQMGDIKEALFAEGRTTLRLGGRMLSMTMRDIERDPDFRDFLEALTENYVRGLTVLRDDAKAHGQKQLQSIAVGGGASAPFIQSLIRRAPKGGARVTARPATPEWAHTRAFGGNLAPVFPQLAIAIGGALAPDTMLSARAA